MNKALLLRILQNDDLGGFIENKSHYNQLSYIVKNKNILYWLIQYDALSIMKYIVDNHIFYDLYDWLFITHTEEQIINFKNFIIKQSSIEMFQCIYSYDFHYEKKLLLNNSQFKNIDCYLSDNESFDLNKASELIYFHQINLTYMLILGKLQHFNFIYNLLILNNKNELYNLIKKVDENTNNVLSICIFYHYDDILMKILSDMPTLINTIYKNKNILSYLIYHEKHDIINTVYDKIDNISSFTKYINNPFFINLLLQKPKDKAFILQNNLKTSPIRKQYTIIDSILYFDKSLFHKIVELYKIKPYDNLNILKYFMNHYTIENKDLHDFFENLVYSKSLVFKMSLIREIIKCNKRCYDIYIIPIIQSCIKVSKKKIHYIAFLFNEIMNCKKYNLYQSLLTSILIEYNYKYEDILYYYKKNMTHECNKLKALNENCIKVVRLYNKKYKCITSNHFIKIFDLHNNNKLFNFVIIELLILSDLNKIKELYHKVHNIDIFSKEHIYLLNRYFINKSFKLNSNEIYFSVENLTKKNNTILLEKMVSLIKQTSYSIDIQNIFNYLLFSLEKNLEVSKETHLLFLNNFSSKFKNNHNYNYNYHMNHYLFLLSQYYQIIFSDDYKQKPMFYCEDIRTSYVHNNYKKYNSNYNINNIITKISNNIDLLFDSIISYFNNNHLPEENVINILKNKYLLCDNPIILKKLHQYELILIEKNIIKKPVISLNLLFSNDSNKSLKSEYAQEFLNILKKYIPNWDKNTLEIEETINYTLGNIFSDKYDFYKLLKILLNENIISEDFIINKSSFINRYYKYEAVLKFQFEKEHFLNIMKRTFKTLSMENKYIYHKFYDAKIINFFTKFYIQDKYFQDHQHLYAMTLLDYNRKAKFINLMIKSQPNYTELLQSINIEYKDEYNKYFIILLSSFCQHYIEYYDKQYNDIIDYCVKYNIPLNTSKICSILLAKYQYKEMNTVKNNCNNKKNTRKL